MPTQTKARRLRAARCTSHCKNCSHYPRGVRIRAGTFNERDACVDLWLEALRDRDGQDQGSEVAARVRAKFESPEVRFAIVDEPPIAFALTVDPGRSKPRIALLELLAVAPSHAGRGLGRALLADAMRVATEHGFSAIELRMREGNRRAEALYVSAGFLPRGEPAPHPLGGPPMIEYTRELLRCTPESRVR